MALSRLVWRAWWKQRLGFSNLESIASYNDYVGLYRLEALHFGAGDYAASVGGEDD